MGKKNNLLRLSPYILGLILLSFLVGIALYDHLPDKIPMHWNLKGEVDSYGSKFYGTFSLPFFTLITYLILIALPKIDPKRENYAQFAHVYNIFTALMVLFLLSLYGVVLLASFGYQPNVGVIVRIGLGLLFIVMGIYLPKIKHNYFIGIRTPWTLASEEVWIKTHKVGGILFVSAGVLIILSILFDDVVGFFITMFSIFLFAAVSTVYSYLVYRKSSNSR